LVHFTQFQAALSPIKAAVATTLCVDGHHVTTEHLNTLTCALTHMNTPDFTDEESWTCCSNPLMSVISSVQLNYLRGYYDRSNHAFLHAYLALLGTMQNLVFLNLTQVKQVLNWIQELFSSRSTNRDDVPDIIDNIEHREAAIRTSKGKMGPRSFSLAWPRPLSAFVNKRPRDLTANDAEHIPMDLEACSQVNVLLLDHVDKKCRNG
jgi:hypothetical protein